VKWYHEWYHRKHLFNRSHYKENAMATNLLSAIKVERAKPREKEYMLNDGNGLYFLVRPDGSKLWVFRYTFSGKRHKMGLGAYSATSGVSLEGARRAAQQARDELAQDRDPHLARSEREADEEARRQAEAGRMTVRRLFDLWFERSASARKDRGAEVRRSFERDILPNLGNVMADEVTRGQIVELLDDVARGKDRAKPAPVMARHLLADLRQMFGFGLDRELITHDPTARLKKSIFGRRGERDRVLNDDEIRQLVTMLPDSGLQEASQAAIWIMLATCCRVGEISRAQWKDIDLEAGTWRIPPDNSKNGKEHTVFLSEFAKGHFQALHDLANGSPWVLPASQKDGHVCVKSLAKQIGDRQRGEDKEPMAHRSRGTEVLALPRGRWTPHDLRRTGATLMGKLGVRSEVIERCLNHTEQNSLVRIYQRQGLETEQQEAWRLLGGRLEALSAGGNVVIGNFTRAA
jgi:integrase